MQLPCDRILAGILFYPFDVISRRCNCLVGDCYLHLIYMVLSNSGIKINYSALIGRRIRGYIAHAPLKHSSSINRVKQPMLLPCDLILAGILWEKILTKGVLKSSRTWTSSSRLH